ncbi:MAG TPA: ATP-binding protein [Kofleriaceae bacterium]|jgi:signal transduction histidine kinase|nr:ATP-binding protein [Kofleriaceae bacterium]
MSGRGSASGIEQVFDDLSDASWTRRVEGLQTVTARLASDRLGPDHETRLVAVLSELAHDPKWEVRKAVTVALAEYHGPEPHIRAVLDELARDANRWVSQAAGRALRRVRERSGHDTVWTLTAPVQDPILEHIAKRTREIGLRSLTPALIYDIAMEINERSYRELAADTAHEIRTLLTPLEGYLVGLRRHLAARGHIDDRADHYLTAALARLQQIQAFTEDLCTYSSAAETGFVAVPVAEVVNDAVTIGFDHMENGSGLSEIAREIEVSPGLVVEAMRERLTRAIANVVTNALQAMPAGGKLSVRARQVGLDVELTVADTGCGMSPEVVEQARLRFRTTRRDQGGTGLGLPIADRIVAGDHGGELIIDSLVGKGTTVTIRLPARQRSGER